MSVDSNLLIFLLVSLSTGGLAGTVLLPMLESMGRRRQRFAVAAGGASKSKEQGRSGKHKDGARRRRQIEQTLHEIQEQRGEREGRQRKLTIKSLLQQAGLSITPTTFWVLTGVSTIVCAALVAFLVRIWVLPAGIFGGAFGLLLPRLVVGFLRNRRLKRFAADFPDAIDVVVRGVRAGRPVADCMAIVASDSAEPIRGEFRKAVEDSAIGLSVDEVTERLADRVPLQEVSFLAIVVAIQARSGGSLTEALSNLSSVLRGRKQLRAKVKAMSAEAKASAGIIGSLPLCVAVLLQVTSPDYLSLLYTDTIGQIVLACSALWMSIGILVMRQMINFDM